MKVAIPATKLDQGKHFMTREVRKVPANWQHPSDGNFPDGKPRFDPLFSANRFISRAAQWDEDATKWELGEFPEEADDNDRALSFEEWDGPRPNPDDYMPLWPESECTHFMMYELSTEGTPISPAFETLEELATWLADNQVCLYANEPTNYEQWLKVCNGEPVELALTPQR
ncbi:Hypothetical protein (plasmid) [Pseudomonas putida]|uniref:Uncharacterized protein n=4 Tax=Pseudomonas TaxID=286 RepID=A0A1X0ZX45_PSEPU|nr:hypothetical protein B7H18_26035 [Pseudomonas putida]PLP92145.1 hypothetical protein CX682_09340 [Pseudomonas sp. FFUP_PS_41]QDQ70461.1 hypothetical protein pJBCL41_00147 [Pseudomonas sp.]ORL58755.1 hypothetical protein B7H17_24820 [Pseudomonas putida]ORL64176.1 hypothetical protein B7H19_24770 [Pseudomonas putida]